MCSCSSAPHHGLLQAPEKALNSVMAYLCELNLVGLGTHGVQGWQRGATQAHGADGHKQIARLVAAPLHISDLVNRNLPCLMGPHVAAMQAGGRWR